MLTFVDANSESIRCFWWIFANDTLVNEM